MGKIIVASYTQWRKVKTADYGRFHLTVDDEYKRLDSDAFVHDHKGELLYFFPYNPAEVMAFQQTVIDLDEDEDFDYDEARAIHRDFIIHHDGGKYGTPYTSYFMRGTDCSGVPCFAHHSGDSVAERYTGEWCERVGYSMFDFEPLTVKMVRQWIGWFLYGLENSYLQIGKTK